MSIKTFWTIFLKVVGIWLILNNITAITQSFAMLSFGNIEHDLKDFVLLLGILFLTVGVFVLSVWLFVFHPGWIIDKLQLDKGFSEQRIELNTSRSAILTITTIVIGGLILADGLPQFCSQVFIYVQQKNSFIDTPSSGWIIFYAAKCVVGYLLMSNSSFIVNLIEKRAKEQD